MASKINISIPQPCNENWRAMTIVEKGRFCSSCQKNVFDFTTSSDRQIIETVKNNENLCGRFTASQLNRDLITPKQKSSIWLASTSAIISFLGLGSQEVFAQGEPIKTEQTDKKMVSKDENVTIFNDEKEITGIVLDVTFNSVKGTELPGAKVVIKGTTIETQTDLDGEFSINAKEGDVLIFIFPGMDSINLIVAKANTYEIRMKDNGTREEILIGKVIK